MNESEHQIVKGKRITRKRVPKPADSRWQVLSGARSNRWHLAIMAGFVKNMLAVSPCNNKKCSVVKPTYCTKKKTSKGW